MDPPADTDSLVADAFKAVAVRLTATGFAGNELREREQLDPFTKDEFERRVGVRPVSRTLQIADFPGVGSVDVVVSRPKALIELKWSYLIPDKIFESVWDAIKLALIGRHHRHDALYLVTGASLTAWSASESADLFATGEVDPVEMWSRALIPPRSPNRGKTVGEDLVIGGRGNQPLRAPARIEVRRVTSARVARDYELRVVHVSAVGPLIEWPKTEIGAAASQEPRSAIASDGSFQLPPRVTQRWIEITAPTVSPEAVGPFLHALRTRGWSEIELRERVLPHLPPP